MPVYTSSIEVTADYPTIKPSLNLNFARSRSLDPRITFTRASTATYVGRDGFVKTAGEDEPRFDHDPETLESLGLLIEGTRTNQLGSHNGTYVGNFRQTNQGLNTTGPDGVTNSAREFTVNSNQPTGGSTLIVANTNLGTNGTTKSWSCFLKVTRSDYIAFQFYDNNNAIFSDVYTLYADGSDPVYQSAGNNGSVRVDKYPNGWYRFRWEGFIGSSNNTSYLQIYSQNHISADGSNVGYAIWGQSFETGHKCSSPILTTGSSATRPADNAIINQQVASGNITIVGDYKMRMRTDNQWNRLFGFGEGSSDVRPFLTDVGSIIWYNYGTNAPTTDWSALGLSTPDDVSFKFAMAIRQNVANSVSVNGTAVSTQTNTNPGAYVNWNELYLGNSDTGTGPRNMTGTIKEFRVYNDGLTDAQLQLLTS